MAFMKIEIYAAPFRILKSRLFVNTFNYQKFILLKPKNFFMETKEFKDFVQPKELTPCNEFVSSGMMALEHESASELTKRFRHKFGHQKSPAYFLCSTTIATLNGIPNMDGIRIYSGLTEDDIEVLIIVGTTQIGDKNFDVFEYDYKINNNNTLIKNIPAPVYVLRPCPPPVPCPPKNFMNVDNPYIT